jgi:teichoic acid transport system permease protein
MMTALMSIISADIIEFIKAIRVAFFWLSGILFNVHGKKSLFFALNPISYLAEGFRNCFAFHIWIWEQGQLFLYFAIVMFVLSTVTFLLFKRLENRIPELI